MNITKEKNISEFSNATSSNNLLVTLITLILGGIGMWVALIGKLYEDPILYWLGIAIISLAIIKFIKDIFFNNKD